ncbi:hypothetical protein [Amycolatopsis albispora]|uniref:Uncharacterized protein n=1 Tax=Amycolatopsis albispora TaxID=1804986 RepID=A0A344L5C3_9PSEU|nr:hypothetical protein [Amycolatopsis albispora]AXB43247.1 hypothetical protein A4R43_12370 [Amycolatopsis albispora]
MTGFNAALQAADESFGNTRAAFDKHLGAAKERLDRTRRDVTNPPAALHREAVEYFRDGRGGPTLQSLQLAVDTGTTTWADIALGRAGALSEQFKADAATIAQVCKQLADAYHEGGDPRAFTEDAW